MSDLIAPDIAARLNAIEPALAELRSAVAAVAARVSALEAPITPPPPPPPPPPVVTDTVHVGASLGASKTMIGWTSVQQQDASAATSAILAKCAHINNHHIIGFGANNPIQTAEGGPYNFAYLDSIFGYPQAGNGYFPASRRMCVTLCGSPPYMRVAKPGTAPNPMGAPLTGLYDFVPPHWSHHHNFALLAAAIITRYPWITDLQWWNEGKGYYYGTPATGSVMVPPGSNLPAVGGNDRDWIEGMTACYNEVWTECKKARPDIRVLGPYLVTRSYTATPAADLANGTFPMQLSGPWGYADRKALRSILYFIENCKGIDALCLDTKTSTNDIGVTPEYQWSGHQRLIDWQAWIRKLATYDPAKYARPGADCSTIGMWFAEAYSRVAGAFTTSRHQEAVATDAWALVNYVYRTDTECWMRWMPEGRGTDPATAHSISLWNQSGSALSLQPTEATPVYEGFVSHFPPGTPLFDVAVDNPSVAGIASPTTLCLVSRSAAPVDHLIISGAARTLAPYEVAFIGRAP